jgi:agmatine deiminase
MNANASETQSGKRVAAEWEPQEAIWLQWSGEFERVFQPAFAQMAAIISRYVKLNILFASTNDRPAL